MIRLAWLDSLAEDLWKLPVIYTGYEILKLSLRLAAGMCIQCMTNLFLSIPLKPGPSEPRLENQEEIEADSTTQEAKEQGFVPEEEFSDVSHSFVITL